MRTSTSIILTALTALGATMPTSNLGPRAGGPAIVLIPSTCTVTDPTSSDSPIDFLPNAATSDVLLYSAYYPSPSTSKIALAEQCVQQCYGYGDHTECKAAFWAENVVVPEGYYGSEGGQLATACLFYTRALTSDDLETAPDGQGTDAYARNIAC